MKFKMQNKKGVSLMISYVLLVTVAIIMSIIVFSYLQYIANVEPVIDCKAGTSLIVEDYICEEGKISLIIRNNGRFNVKGFIPTFGGNRLREPADKFVTLDTARITPSGDYEFEEPLAPGDFIKTNFSSNVKRADAEIVPASFEFLRNLKIQPYIYDEEAALNVPCSAGIIRQDVEDCRIKATYAVPVPKVYYEFEGTFLDTQGNANIDRSHPARGAQKYVEGYLGQAINFDGTYYLKTKRQDINNDLSGELLSISFWIKKESDNSVRLIKKGSAGGFHIRLNDSQIITLMAQFATEPFSGCTTNLPAQWTHVTFTAKKNGKQRVYIDGNLCSEFDVGTRQFLKSPNHMYIGSGEFIGKMDEIKIWDLELSSEQVSALYSSYTN